MSDSSESHFVAGIDEAGLGPMLGPLCVGLTVFEAPILSREPYRLWPLFDGLVGEDHKERKSRMVVCDSKKLHSSSRGVRDLEASLFPFLHSALGRLPLSLREFWEAFCAAPIEAMQSLPWYADSKLELPLAEKPDKLEVRGQKLRAFFDQGPLRLKEIKTLPVVVPEFNRLIDQYQNKSDVNLSAFATLIDYAWTRYPKLSMACDRLGARAYYATQLQAILKPESVETLRESETLSAYILRRGEAELRISFRVSADESCFPVALASMAAKYLRELSMEAFNEFFAKQQPGLKATKGYVTDARRWLAETAVMREAAEFDDHTLIRKR